MARKACKFGMVALSNRTGMHMHVRTDEKPTQTKTSKSFLKCLGPGLITGASDDDPSGIATYSQAGAAYGFGLLWTMLFSFPLMSAAQEISARIGRVTGRGLAGNISRYYSAWILYPIVFLLIVANTINIGADIGAMGEALQLLLGGWALLYAILFAVLCVVLQVFIPYTTYSCYLKWLTLVLFSYVATVFAIHVPWKEALRGTFIPSITNNGNYWATFIAILGTTISPYLFFWQASQETEEIRDKPEDEALTKAPEQAREQFGRIKFDTYIGMALSNVVAFFIILAAAVTFCTPRGSPTSKHHRRRPKRSGPSPGGLRSSFLRWGSSAPGCWPSPCLRDPPRTRSARP